ncbi:MAG: sigma 54-interacting transcriptional regulator [Candidatus Sumerlaeia bacterium]|nr:sigma 54-interacting transcriptional regulator [Candidatus Sumerlaeia bacterium]
MQRVMQGVVDGLTGEDICYALARIWVKGPGDLCGECRFQDVCPNRNECLHLMASAGRSDSETGERWTRVDGGFRRFPLGHRKVGRIGATGESLLLHNLAEKNDWIADRAWAERERIRSFAGHPLVFRGEVLGVLGIFCRAGIDDTAFRWLRVFADHAAIAIANARAFEEIDRLRRELELENDLLRAEIMDTVADSEIVGSGPRVRQMLEQIELVAKTEAAVLIQGESGTGKELVARALHRRSRRADRPLIKVNCAAIPRELFESEFFGHVKGAFTGAVRDRVGRFQLADRGTLFLDEVGEIPLDLQSKLLRVLQEGEFERIGEASTRKVNVRVIAATNRDLQREAREGRFREDLYFRLGVFPISVPPLRDRTGDIPELVSHFLKESARRLGVAEPGVSRADLERLKAHPWPGNIRELGHAVERAVIMARGGRADFRLLVDHAPGATPERPRPSTEPADVHRDADVRAQQISNIRRALHQTDGRIYGPGGAAELLGIPPTTLASRVKRWKIEL